MSEPLKSHFQSTLVATFSTIHVMSTEEVSVTVMFFLVAVTCGPSLTIRSECEDNNGDNRENYRDEYRFDI